MIEILSVENMRKSDAWTIANRTPGKELMLRAGQRIFESVDWQGPVAIVCGSGNNAGDGFVLAELLRNAGIPCRLVLLGEKCSEDGRFYLDRCVSAGVPVLPWAGPESLRDARTIVDCIFGTGFRGEVRGVARDAIQAINEQESYVVSVDINSGLSGDSGIAECCVRSDLTVSVGSFQPGHFLGMAKDVIKKKVNCPIGIDPVDPPFILMEEADLRPFFPARPHLSNKGSYGYIALIGGSERYSGAIRLASLAAAAMRSGAGVVKTAFPASLYSVIAPALLEPTAFPLPDQVGQLSYDPDLLAELTNHTAASAFGMGIGTSDGAKRSLRWLLENAPGRLVIDADGLTLLSRMENHRQLLRKAASRPDAKGPRVILTPHLKEFSRLTGVSVREIEADPIPLARAYAADTASVLLLKGPATIITDGSHVWLTDTGCPGMATAGSGDVLSGILTALAGWMEDVRFAAVAAAWINGRAGELAEAETNSVSMVAGDTVRCIPRVISGLLP